MDGSALGIIKIKGGVQMKALKLKAVVVAVVLVAALVAGNTMAWFTSSANVQAATFTAGTVGISVTSPVVEGEGNQYFNYMNYSVKDFHQGIGVNEANRIVTAGDYSTVYNKISKLSAGKPEIVDFYTMGKSAENESEAFVTIELDKVLPGSDKVRLVECSWGSANIEEIANVYVSADNAQWTYIDTVKNTESKPGDQHPSTIVIPSDVGDVKYIKIVDATTKTNSDGYDIDYLGVFLMDNETNWNPGDTNYIAFKINNDGSKKINLRALVSGTWNNGLDADNVTYELAGSSVDDWLSNDDKTEFTYKYDINGSYNKPAGSVYLFLKVKLDGAATDNNYQGIPFTLTPTFQAIQASHSSDDDGAKGWTWDNVKFDTGAKLN